MTIAELFVKLGIKAGAEELAEIDKFLKKAEKKADGLFQRFNKAAGKKLGGLMKAGFMAAGVGIAGVFASGAKSAIDFERGLTRLDIASGGAMGSVEGVREQMLKVSRDTGVAKEEILEGVSAFVALTGDGKAAAQSMDLFARIAKATGASMGDISGAAAAMQQNLKLNPAEFEKAFSILIRGGKLGAVELKDMAGLLAGLAPLAARFKGGSGVEGLAKLGTAFQLARQGTGSAAEAATSLEALMGAIVQNAKKLEKAKIKIFDEKVVNGKKVKELRDFQSIIDAIQKSELGRDPTKLIAALGRKEAEAAFIQLTKVQGAWGKIAAETMAADDVARDYAKYQNSTAGKLEKAWNAVQVTIANAFTPERVARFADALGKALGIAERLTNLISDIMEHGVDTEEEANVRRKAEQAVMSGPGSFSDRFSRAVQAGDDAVFAHRGKVAGQGVNTPRMRAEIAASRREQTSRAIEIANTITLNIKGAGDPVKDAARMRIELDRWWDARLRELQGAVAQ